MLNLTDLKDVGDRRRGQGKMYDLPHVAMRCVLGGRWSGLRLGAIVRFIDVRLGRLRQRTVLAWRRASGRTGFRVDPAGAEPEGAGGGG